MKHERVKAGIDFCKKNVFFYIDRGKKKAYNLDNLSV